MAKKKTIRMTLSERSINRAINEIENYKRTLLDKTRELVEELAAVGIRTVNSSMANIQGDSDPAHTNIAKFQVNGNRVKATLVVKGEDLLFIEFGAGIHYNGSGSPHPKGTEMGYTIGSYGKGHGNEDSWVYYDDKTDKWKTSHGTKAAMPVYNASVEIQQQFKQVAKKVFGD